jgi:hypothetical protein
MYTEEVKGLVIFTGIVAMYTFVLLGCLEGRLKKVARAVKQADEDSKYVS